MTLLERVAQWPEQWLEQGRREGAEQGRREGAEQGRREGVEQGRREALARERAMLRRQVVARFDEEVARRVDPLLGAMADVERFVVAAELIVSVPTDSVLIERLGHLSRDQ